MNPSIWSRMPDDARERVLGAPESLRAALVDLWDCAQQAGSEAQQWAAPDPEAQADVLDEELVRKATKGDYGPAARDAVGRCVLDAAAVGQSRRQFLRSARKAIAGARSTR